MFEIDINEDMIKFAKGALVLILMYIFIRSNNYNKPHYHHGYIHQPYNYRGYQGYKESSLRNLINPKNTINRNSRKYYLTDKVFDWYPNDCQFTRLINLSTDQVKTSYITSNDSCVH